MDPPSIVNCLCGNFLFIFFQLFLIHNDRSSFFIISHALPFGSYYAFYERHFSFHGENGAGQAARAVSGRSDHSSFLFSAPGVVTITFSGVMISAPLAAAAPWNICLTIVLNVSTTVPSVT